MTLTPEELSNWKLIEAYYNAWIVKDFSKVKFAADFTYRGPGGQHFTNPKDFLATAAPVSQIVKDIVIHKKLIQGNEIAVFYDFVTAVPEIGVIPTSGLYTLHKGEIKSIHNYFDPKALHEFKEKMKKVV
jgi:hypothetical protein